MGIPESAARLTGAKAALKAWLTDKGLTVPDGTLLDGLVDILSTIIAVEPDTPTLKINPSNGMIAAATNQQTGYVTGSIKAATMQLATYSGQTITPGTAGRTLAKEHYLLGDVIIKGDTNLKAENIASGISIFGVSGSHEGGGAKTASGTHTIVSSTSSFSITHNLGALPNFVYFYGTIGTYPIAGFWLSKDTTSANYFYYMMGSNSAINNTSSWHLSVSNYNSYSVIYTYKTSSTTQSISSATLSWFVAAL